MPKSDIPRQVFMVAIDKIVVPDERITSVVDDELMRDLIQSIKQHGIKVPIKLIFDGKQMVLIDGLHRLLAAKALGIRSVPALIEKAGHDEVLIQNVLLNRLRGKSDPVQEGMVLRTLMREYNISLAEAARRCNIPPSTASKLVRIAGLPEEVRLYVRQGRLGTHAAFELTKLVDETKILQVAREAVEWGYTVEQMRERVKQLLLPPEDQTAAKYVFSETGEPQRVPTLCWACGREIQGNPTYVWMCPQCQQLIQAALADMRRREQGQQ